MMERYKETLSTRVIANGFFAPRLTVYKGNQEKEAFGVCKVWSIDEITHFGGSKTVYNTNYQWICEGEIALGFFLSEEIRRFINRSSRGA